MMEQEKTKKGDETQKLKWAGQSIPPSPHPPLHTLASSRLCVRETMSVQHPCAVANGVFMLMMLALICFKKRCIDAEMGRISWSG